MTWACMRSKQATSQSLVLKKGKTKLRFTLVWTQIPSITEKRAVGNSGQPGKFKAWICQHGMLPRILWPLLVYEVQISIVEGFDRRVSRFLWKWLELPQSLSNIALYGQNNKLPISSLNEEFIVIQGRSLRLGSRSRLDGSGGQQRP